jgi:ketosteroid isomerase-like protein
LPTRGEQTIVELFEAVRDGDLEAARAILHPDAVYVNAPEALEPGERQGREAFIAAVRLLMSTVELTSGGSRIDRAVDAGSQSAFAVTLTGAGQSSQAAFTQSFGVLMRFEGEQLIRYEWFQDPEAPFAGLGVPGR